MPFQDDRVTSRSGSVPIPGLNRSEPSSGPLPAEEDATRPLPTASVEKQQALSTGQLSPFVPPTTGQLTHANMTRVLTTVLPRVSDSTTSQRVPVVIKGSMKKLAPPLSPLPPASHRKRRLAVTLLGLLMLVLVTSLALFTVTPLGHDMGINWSPLSQSGGNVLTGQPSGLSNLVAQATATAVFHRQTDGYSGGNAQMVGNGAGSLAWPYGQCTFWANSRYHTLTGIWVSWSGNANQWVIGAHAAGWNVSSSPHVPSIIVLMGVQGANAYYGHVAVVESASGNTVHTSNMNWYANGGGFGTESFVDFTTGPGVYFIWK